MDYFTKWSEAYVLPKQKASTVTLVLVNEFISRCDIPAEIHSDLERNFSSLLGIHKRRLLYIRSLTAIGGKNSRGLAAAVWSRGGRRHKQDLVLRKSLDRGAASKQPMTHIRSLTAWWSGTVGLYTCSLSAWWSGTIRLYTRSLTAWWSARRASFTHLTRVGHNRMPNDVLSSFVASPCSSAIYSSRRSGLLPLSLCVAKKKCVVGDAGGRSARSEVSNHCVCAFNVSARDCDQTTGEYHLLKSSMMALQSQFGLKAGQLKDIVKLVNALNKVRAENVKLAGKQKELTNENVKLRQEIATIKAVNAGGSTPSAANLKQCSRRDLNDESEYGVILVSAWKLTWKTLEPPLSRCWSVLECTHVAPVDVGR
ncbi:hypothetical protein LSAT2_027367 [Lamellibrachia satsuma]|nr:hypothetical protein LSAT2_027367 [Lamellibrachia satsuma]